MEALVMMAGAWQLTSWIFALLDAIEKAPPTSRNVRRAGNPRK